MVLVRAHWGHWLWLLAIPAAAAEDVSADPLEIDAEFLEYLGSWQDGDEDWWIAVSHWEETSKQESTVEQEREDDEQGG